MRILKRNEQPFWYALYEGRRELGIGNLRTGQTYPSYSDPIPTRGNISAARGDTTASPFGDDVTYDKVIALGEDLGLDEHSIIWIDKDPEAGEEHDYIVRRVAKSINGVLLAISRVDVRGEA